MLTKSHLMVLLTAMLLLLFNCSNPVDEPLRWSSAAEVPVTNEMFNLKEQFDKMFDYTDTMKVIDPDSSKIGDTLQYIKSSIDTVNFEQSENTIDTQSYRVVLGPFPLTGVSTGVDTVSLPAPAGSFSVSFPLFLDKVYQAIFYDTVTNLLSIKVDNLSSSVLTDVQIGIIGIDTQTIMSIDANASETVTLEVAGKSLIQRVPFVFSGTAGSAGPKQLSISFSLNGLIVSKCKVDDHLVKFDRVFSANYDITDTIAMDYIDIDNGRFEYTINNSTGLKLRAIVDHQHLWQGSYCINNNLESLNDIIKFKSLNTSFYSGYITGTNITRGEEVLPFESWKLQSKNINGTRLFTLWDTVKNKTYTSIKYTIASDLPKGDTLTLSATDSLSFRVNVLDLKFKEFLGTVMKPYERIGDPQKVVITLPKPLNESVKDSLRGKMVLSNVSGIVSAKTEMPQRSFIDTMAISFTAYMMDAVQVRDSTLTTFVNVKNDSVFNRLINITNVTNQFPDTVLINTVVRIPKGTRMRVCNNITSENYAGSNSEYMKYIGQMTVKIITNYVLSPKLDWTIIAPANLDLGNSKFPVIKPLRFVRKMENRRVLMNLKIRNNSNLNMYLYSLIAPQKLVDTLDSMSTDEFVRLVSQKDSAEKHGFVNFLGINGVLVPSRKATDPVISEVELSHSQLETILSSDTCSWRWLAKFETQGRDALTDTDYIDIHSKLRVDGTNSTDSLMIW